jgi:superfamily I DNA/RNA helicase
VQTWFSFLLQHGVRPFQGYFFDRDIKGMNLVSGKSVPFIKEDKVEKHYFDEQDKIYSDKISKFVMKCNDKSCGKIIGRLSRIYQYIFIDEVQDLAGYDLEFLKLLFKSDISTLLVCDPRQGTYSTSNSPKNRQYAKSGILEFFKKVPNVAQDDSLFTINYRSILAICDLSNRLFPDCPKTTSGNQRTTDHDGIFMVRPKDVCLYLAEHLPMQLRYDKKKDVANNYSVINFGESKGLSFDRVLIFPTEPIVKWLKDNSSELAPTSRSKLYVAITRARYSVAFVYDYKDHEIFDGISKFETINH